MLTGAAEVALHCMVSPRGVGDVFLKRVKMETWEHGQHQNQWPSPKL